MRISYLANLLGLAMVVGAATLLVARLDSKPIPNLARGALVTASSRSPSSPDPALLVDGDPFHLGVQTEWQQYPWVQVDLGQETLIHQIIVFNRIDCCTDRADPLALQLSQDGERFIEVARRTGQFDKWAATMALHSARFIRAQVPKEGCLHLTEIEVH